MTKLDFVKTAASFVVGAGTTTIVASIIKNNVQPRNAYDKVTVVAGSIALGSMAASATKKYTADTIDEMADWWKKNVKN